MAQFHHNTVDTFERVAYSIFRNTFNLLRIIKLLDYFGAYNYCIQYLKSSLIFMDDFEQLNNYLKTVLQLVFYS